MSPEQLLQEITKRLDAMEARLHQRIDTVANGVLAIDGKITEQRKFLLGIIDDHGRRLHALEGNAPDTEPAPPPERPGNGASA